MLNRFKPKSEFNRNILTLMTGTTIAQAIPIAISPILTRIYTPEDFGIFAIFLAITLIIGSIANGRYELAIMVPKKDEDAINIFALGFIITTFISLLLLVLILIFQKYFFFFLKNEEIGLWLYFIPISVFFFGIFNILNYFNNRKKNYKDISNANILKSIIAAIMQLLIGFIQQGATGLISGQIISQFFANTKLFKNIIKDKKLISKITKKKILALAKRYKNFPKYSMPSGLLNIVSLQVPVFLLGAFFNTAIVGFYSLSYRFISLPMSIIGSSIGQVFFQKCSEFKNDKKALKKITLETYKKLFKIGILPFSIITVFGDYIFAFVFGKDWIAAGEYSQILAISILFLFIKSPISSLFINLKKQKDALIFNIIIIFSRVLILFFGGYFLKDIYITIFLYSAVGVFLNLSMLFYFFKILNINILNEIVYLVANITIVILPICIIRLLFH
jgi:O-antigen/teichoic acid export membrane protein